MTVAVNEAKAAPIRTEKDRKEEIWDRWMEFAKALDILKIYVNALDSSRSDFDPDELELKCEPSSCLIYLVDEVWKKADKLPWP
jgi:hypothetical protein